ncbi:hypothetical protein Tco_0991889 [Tanacetum coccineum]|uniref:Transposase MuDR plant domain-containing protein n=1 Tax=Tanacetum coccineum TaxID=301880 RepID=A0ABQ5F1U8_9ASTR
MLASMVCHSRIFFATIRRLVLVSPTSMHYKITSDPLTALKLLETNENLCSFVKACYENNLKIDLFTQHNGYGIMEMIDEDLHPKKPVSHLDSDSDVETNHPLDDVAHVVKQIEYEDDGNVNIPRMTTDDPCLNKLVGNGTFIGQTENPNPNLQGRFLLEVEDRDDEQVESKFKAKKNVSYPSFNLDTPWNECKPVLGMRFKIPQQLKHMLANYGVQHGYQLWYMQQDHNKLLVFCGRDVSEGKCAGLKGKKPKKVDNEECETSKQGSKKGDGRKAVNEILNKAVKERWDKKKECEKKGRLLVWMLGLLLEADPPVGGGGKVPAPQVSRATAMTSVGVILQSVGSALVRRWGDNEQKYDRWQFDSVWIGARERSMSLCGGGEGGAMLSAVVLCVWVVRVFDKNDRGLEFRVNFGGRRLLHNSSAQDSERDLDSNVSFEK